MGLHLQLFHWGQLCNIHKMHLILHCSWKAALMPFHCFLFFLTSHFVQPDLTESKVTFLRTYSSVFIGQRCHALWNCNRFKVKKNLKILKLHFCKVQIFEKQVTIWTLVWMFVWYELSYSWNLDLSAHNQLPKLLNISCWQWGTVCFIWIWNNSWAQVYTFSVTKLISSNY